MYARFCLRKLISVDKVSVQDGPEVSLLRPICRRVRRDLCKEISLTPCSNVARSRMVLRSQIHAFPSVAPVTTTPGLVFDPVISTNTIDSMLSPSVCPPRVETISPLVRPITRRPPAAPPTTASVEEGFTAMDVMPSKSNRASSGPNLKMGVDERGSQKIRCPSAQAETILLPGNFCED